MSVEKQDRLYDALNAWSFGRGKNANVSFAAMGDEDAMTRHMMKYRGLTRQARRFYLENDFLGIAVGLSREWQKAQQWINIARLPYPVMWVEFDLHEKIRLVAENGGSFNTPTGEVDLSNVPTRMGFLFEEINKETGTWTMTTFNDGTHTTRANGMDVMPDPVVWVLSPEGNSIDVIRPPKPHKPLKDIFPNEFHRGIESVGIGVTAEHSRFSVAFLPWIENRMQVCMEPLWRTAQRGYEKHLMDRREMDVAAKVREQTIETLNFSLSENRGSMRLVIAILALMNQAPDVNIIHKEASGHRMAGARRVPHLGHSTVHLKLPKTKSLTRLFSLLDVQSADRRRHRAHEVRGHFRMIEKGNPLPFKCDHSPTMVENGLGICVRCERMIKWIPHHQRGDAGIGWVNHDYIVEGS